MNFTEGSSFFLDNGNRHLWAIISDPAQSNNEIVIVNFTTYRNTGYEDMSCIVEGGKHPKIKTKSYIYYRRSEIVDLSQLELWYKTGDLKPQDCLSPDLLEKIRLGAKENPFLPLEVERVLSAQELI